MTFFAGAPLRTIEFVMVGADASFPGGTERCVSAEGEESSVNERLAAIVRLRLGGWDVNRGTLACSSSWCGANSSWGRAGCTPLPSPQKWAELPQFLQGKETLTHAAVLHGKALSFPVKWQYQLHSLSLPLLQPPVVSVFCTCYAMVAKFVS